MNHEYTSLLKQLRETIAIGLSEGLQLLKTHDGDLKTLISSFKKQSLYTVMARTRQHEAYVLPLLEQYKFDTARVIEVIEEQLSLINATEVPSTEYYLHKFRKHKQEAIDRIASLIIARNNIPRLRAFEINAFPWFREHEISHLDEYSLPVIVITEWLDYEDQEPFGCVVGYNTDLVSRQMEKIGLPELAREIRRAAAIQLRVNRVMMKGVRSNAVRSSLYRDNKKFNKARRRFRENKALLIDSLYDFIAGNKVNFT